MDEYRDRTLKILLDAVNDPDETVRICAVRALTEIGIVNSNVLRQIDWLSLFYPEEAMEIALKTGVFTERSKQSIYSSLQAAPAPVIELAARALARIGSPLDKETGCGYLRRQMLESEFDSCRESSARSLRYLGCSSSENIAALLCAASQDYNGRVRVSALESLCFLGYRVIAIPCLKEIALEEKDLETRVAAMLALANQKQETALVIREARKALQRLQKSETVSDAILLDKVIECVHQVGKGKTGVDREVVSCLREIAQSHYFNGIRMKALRALVDIEENPVEFLRQSLQNDSHECRSLSLGILIQRGTLILQDMSGFVRGTDIDWRVLSRTVEKGARVAPEVRDKIVSLSSTANWDEKEFALLVLYNLSAFGEKEVEQAIEIATNRITGHESVRGRAIMLLAQWYNDQVS